MILHLASVFPDGWYGGDLPEHGYFGRRPDAGDVLRVLEEYFEAMDLNGAGPSAA